MMTIFTMAVAAVMIFRYGTLHGYVLERRNQLNPGND